MIELTDKQHQMRVAASSDAKHILGVGGARSGKTFAFCYFIDRRAWKAPGSRHLIYRKHGVSAKQSIGMDTLPKVHDLAGGAAPRYYSQDGVFVYPNKSEIWLAGLDDSNIDKVLGKEYATLYGNESSEFGFDIREKALTRLAQKVDQVDGRSLPLKEYIDLNPTTTAHWTYSMWMLGIHPVSKKSLNRDNYSAIFVNPTDNRANLPPSLFETLETMGERNRRRFLLGEYVADVDEALWRRSMIQRVELPPGNLDRIVIAIDPAVSNNAGSDETGIIAGGIGGLAGARQGYVLEDASGRFRPEEWARVALSLYHEMDADCIVAEANQGGDMVEAVIRSIEAGMGKAPARVKLVHATRGKAIRAEPIVGLYERKLIHHVGEFPQLEDQMTAFTVDFDRKAQGYSPDRVDALVWCITELFPGLTVSNRPLRRPTHNPKPRFF